MAILTAEVKKERSPIIMACHFCDYQNLFSYKGMKVTNQQVETSMKKVMVHMVDNHIDDIHGLIPMPKILMDL